MPIGDVTTFELKLWAGYDDDTSVFIVTHHEIRLFDAHLCRLVQTRNQGLVKCKLLGLAGTEM